MFSAAEAIKRTKETRHCRRLRRPRASTRRKRDEEVQMEQALWRDSREIEVPSPPPTHIHTEHALREVEPAKLNFHLLCTPCTHTGAHQSRRDEGK
jgi:hypothetical protein